MTFRLLPFLHDGTVHLPSLPAMRPNPASGSVTCSRSRAIHRLSAVSTSSAPVPLALAPAWYLFAGWLDSWFRLPRTCPHEIVCRPMQGPDREQKLLPHRHVRLTAMR